MSEHDNVVPMFVRVAITSSVGFSDDEAVHAALSDYRMNFGGRIAVVTDSQSSAGRAAVAWARSNGAPVLSVPGAMATDIERGSEAERLMTAKNTASFADLVLHLTDHIDHANDGVLCLIETSGYEITVYDCGMAAANEDVAYVG